MLTRVYLSTATLSKPMQESIDTQLNPSALEHALDARCSESEESSDDSCSSSDESRSDDDDEDELDYEPPSTMTGPRRPSLSLNSSSDRRASTPSQRSPLSINSARSQSSCHYNQPTPSPRTPSMSMRHDAALRSFQLRIDQDAHKSIKARPAMMDITSIGSIATPRIEIEQVYDDEDDEEMELARKDAEMAKTDRSMARQKMLTALGRGSQLNATSTSTAPVPGRRLGSRRVPSLDQISNIYQAKVSQDEIKTPAPKTPGTASPYHHQRNASCPTPTSPYIQQYGEVRVIVTPPTPRLQGPSSPALGVYINGLHGNNGFHHFNDSSYLVAPAFELAAGKQLAKREQESGAMAWMATLQAQQQQMEELCRQQQQVLLSSMQQAAASLPSCHDVLTSGAGLGLMTNFPSPSIIPGTPGAPSMIHIQQQRAILAQQQALQEYYLAAVSSSKQSIAMPHLTPPKSSPRKSSRQSTSASTKSWWRGESTALDSSNSLNSASSGSLYSKSSAGVSNVHSPADSSSAWRRKADDVGCPEKMIKSAVYLPPAKRAALLKEQQQQ